MNREEAIEMWVIPALKNTWNEKKCNEILEALEQEPILDKISAEITANMESIIGKYGNNTPIREMPSAKIERNNAREECLQIIDKYKAEGSDRE